MALRGGNLFAGKLSAGRLFGGWLLAGPRWVLRMFSRIARAVVLRSRI